MPRPRRSDVITAFRTSALLDAARRVFGRSGFEAATIDEIAREAGVAKGTVYLYYRSKRSIYWAAVQEGIAELDALTRERVRHATTLHDAIRDFILTKVEYFDDRRDFFRIYLQELSGQAAGAIVDLTRGIVTRRLMRKRRTAAPTDVDAVVDLIWHGLASKGSLKR